MPHHFVMYEFCLVFILEPINKTMVLFSQINLLVGCEQVTLLSRKKQKNEFKYFCFIFLIKMIHIYLDFAIQYLRKDDYNKLPLSYRREGVCVYVCTDWAAPTKLK